MLRHPRVGAGGASLQLDDQGVRKALDNYLKPYLRA